MELRNIESGQVWIEACVIEEGGISFDPDRSFTEFRGTGEDIRGLVRAICTAGRP